MSTTMVSMVASALAKETVPASSSAVIAAIKGTKYQPAVEAIRKLYAATLANTHDHAAAKRAVDSLKKRLPGIMWSGTFSGRGDANLVDYSHLLCADLDHLEPDQVQGLSKLAENDPHVFASFRSPTDSGLKVVFRVAGGADQHLANFEAGKRHVAEIYGVPIDESCKNVERLCFVSFDPGAFCNEQAIPLEPVSAPLINLPVVTRGPVGDSRRTIAERILGTVTWATDTEGFCLCPGTHLHTTGNGERDCKILLNGAPTVTCFHNSCRGVLDGINHELRSQIGRAEWKPDTEKQSGQLSKLDTDTETEFDYANKLAEVLPPIKTCGSRWHVYKNGEWRELERTTLRPIAQSVLPPIIRTARREASILDHLEGRFQTPADSFAGFYRLTEDRHVLLNAGNGVVRVSESGEVRLEPHSPEHDFTTRIAANYDPTAEAHLFQRVLSEALSDPHDQALLQLCSGNFLLPDCRFETALVCYGEAGRGKSTIAEPIGEALGRSLVPRLSMSQICDPKSYHVPKLKFAAVNLGTELDAIELGDSATFKAIVSGEPIEARPIYGSPFTMSTTCKLWFLANTLPRFKHGTEAELRRTRFLRFDYLPPVKDVTLKAKLAQERDGVFRWMLAGLAELLTLPSIPLGGRHSREVHERFKVGNDPVGTFVASCCHLDRDARAQKDTLRDAYRDFCERNELNAGNGSWFFRSLYDRWPQLAEVRTKDGGGQRNRVVSGIQLKSYV